ncbi:hypothetical protein G7Y79_00007g021660 [Physcia stellaris]|nr:hypothetical protein G7Y79_00007g021660 [Physcia stellaris]
MNEASESQRELDFLRKYRENSRKSKHIMVHLAIIERGNEAHVIYPLAQGDLQKLLEGKLGSLQWDEGDAEQFRDIVRKSCDLADGLDFLHSDMRNYSNLVCRHGDLKPNNFLVYENEWKISDMGLARVQATSTDETGVRKTTKTTSKDGCGPYAAPEMSGPEGTLIGRETDVWSLAAIIMELIIWGFGGPSAWADFVQRREDCSRGLFHKDKALSPAVDQELRSWPIVHCTKMSKFLRQGEIQASEFLKDMSEALRGAFEIDPDKRAKSKDFLNSMENVYYHFVTPKKMKLGIATMNKLEIRTRPSITAWEALQRKFDEHRSNEIFSPDHFKPKEQIRISNETKDCIQKWIRRPTPSALCILTKPGKERLHVSAIIHEVYYTARCMGYEVIEFLTLNRYDRTATTLQAALDFVYCLIFQLLKNKPEDQLKEYDLHKLDIEDASVSSKVKFESAINILKQVIQTRQKDQNSKPAILIVDEFWQVCTITTLDTTRQQWKILLALLGCGKENTGLFPATPNFRILFRANGWFNDLSDLGFSGGMCTPPANFDLSATLRNTLKQLF